MNKQYFLIVFVLFFIQIQAQQNKATLLIGTYTNGCESNGIYVYDFNVQDGNFLQKATSQKVINPSYLTVSPDHKFVYSVNENGEKSSVSAFSFNSDNSKLELLNQQSSKGADPCFIINDAKNVIVANYSGGNITVFNKKSDGSIAEAAQVIQHKGKSANTERQESPHVHMVQYTPDNRYVIANDLGTDKIFVYRYNPNSKTNILEPKDSVIVKAGSGPRHITFNSKSKFAYSLQELDGSITVFHYKKGKLQQVQEATVVAPDFKGQISAAAISISPNGKFLYATNRGTANDISVFKIGKKGCLEFVERVSTLGKGPRSFAIDPTGKFLLIAHQYTNDVVIFSIDKQSGKLTNTGKKIELCSPVCLVFKK